MFPTTTTRRYTGFLQEKQEIFTGNNVLILLFVPFPVPKHDDHVHESEMLPPIRSPSPLEDVTPVLLAGLHLHKMLHRPLRSTPLGNTSDSH